MATTLADIKKVLIIGSGTLGLRIGLQSALSGFDTTIYDIHEKAFDSARKIHVSILKSLVAKKIISLEESDMALKRIHFNLDPVAAANEADRVAEEKRKSEEKATHVRDARPARADERSKGGKGGKGGDYFLGGVDK